MWNKIVLPPKTFKAPFEKNDLAVLPAYLFEITIGISVQLYEKPSWLFLKCICGLKAAIHCFRMGILTAGWLFVHLNTGFSKKK